MLYIGFLRWFINITTTVLDISEDFGSDSILIMLSMKQCMYIEVRPHMCGDSRCKTIPVTSLGGL
jgi:hypothetical protein